MSDEPREGFEYQGRFYEWHLSDMGKDLMLIDRISGMGMSAFFEAAEEMESAADARAPLLLTMIACSIRHGHPAWSVDRVYRTVMDMSLADVTLVGETEADADPLAKQPTNEPSPSASNGSLPSSTPPDNSSSPTSSETPPPSTAPGSPVTTPA
jgi:hypothetical protein